MPGYVVLNLCFLNLVGSASHVVHSGSCGVQNVDVLQ
jgi:hypothetical protein